MTTNQAHHPLFYPKILSTLKDYSPAQFVRDAVSGVIVGIVALPLAIAFGIASGVTPDKGLVTAVVAGFLISLLGGSRVQIGGPTGAFVVIVAGIVARHGVEALLVCTLMAGIILIGMGLMRLGSLIRYIPYPLIVGFTSGIAVIIFSSQIKDALGLPIDTVPPAFFDQWAVYMNHLSEVDLVSFTIFAGSILVIHGWQRFFKKIPGSLMAILLLTFAVHAFGFEVETIGSRYGRLPSGFPWPAFPAFDFSRIRMLIQPALTIAILGGIESLLSATVADGMIEGRHRSNTELIAQGVANLASPLFGGIPATGAIARTATNVKNGGRTPVAGVVHALFLLLILFLFGRWAEFIPLSVLAAILVVVSYHMSEWRAFKALLRAPGMDVVVLLSTFFLTVFVDLTVAVEVGVVLSAVLFMKRMTDVTQIREIKKAVDDTEDEEKLRSSADASSRREIPEGVKIYEAEGALFFGVAETLRSQLDFGGELPKVIIFRMRHVLALDATGMRAIEDLWIGCKKRGIALVLSGVQPQPFRAIKKAGLLMKIGLENVKRTFDDAFARAVALAST